MLRSNRTEVFLRKRVLKTFNKFTGEHPCHSVISINLQSNCFLCNGKIDCKCIKPFHSTVSFHTSGFLMFSGGIEKDQQHEMG